MTPMSTEAEMGGMQAMGQGAWSRGGWRGGKELSLGPLGGACHTHP